MRSRKTLVVVILAVAALVVAGSASLASPSAQGGEALGDVHVSGTVASPGPAGLTINNNAGGYALKGTSQNNIGVLGTSGVATSTAPAGIHGVHGTAAGVGVYGEGGHTGTYGTGSNHGVKGESSSGDGVMGATTSGSANSAGVRARNQGAGPAIVAEGDLYVTGAYRGNLGPNQGAPFPRPAYDSGWVTINPGQEKTLTHNLGGNVDNYVVDLQFKATSLPFQIHSIAYGGDLVGSRREGGYYKNLNTSSVIINRFAHDLQADQMRVRIWVYR